MPKEAVGGVRRIKTAAGIRWEPRYRKKSLHMGLFETPELALEALTAWKGLQPHEPEVATSKTVITFRTFALTWFVAREAAGEIKSVGDERSRFERHILDANFIDWPLSQITAHEIQLWIDGLKKKEAVSAIVVGRRAGEDRRVELRPTGRKVSRKTIKNVRGVLKQIFEQAHIEYPKLVPVNPVAGIRVRKHSKVIEDEDEVWTFLTLEEIDSVFGVLPTIRHKAFFAIAIYCGLREGEILGLRWRDLHLESLRPCIKVRKSFDGTLKTDESRRTVWLLPRVLKYLLDYKVDFDRERRLGHQPVVELNGLVFASDHGGCYADGYDMGWSDRRYRKKKGGPVNVYAGWRTRAGVRREVTFHCLRHTCASQLVMGGFGMESLELDEVKDWLGHSEISVTQRYAHLHPDYIHRKVKQAYEPTKTARKPGLRSTQVATGGNGQLTPGDR